MITDPRPRVDTSDRLPEQLSPSRAKDFMQCPQLFYYKTILRIATPPTIHTLKGNLAHVAFERIFDHPRADRTAATALTYVEPALRLYEEPLAARSAVTCDIERKLRDLDDGWAGSEDAIDPKVQRRVEQGELNRQVIADVGRDELLEQARDTVTGYFQMENPAVFDPHARELHLRATVAGVPVHGFIDRLDRIRDTEGTFRFVVSDYKTGKVPTSDRFKQERFFQLKVYAALLRAIHGETPALLRLVFTSGASPDAVEKLTVTDAMLDATERQLEAVWRGIRRSATRDEWPTKTGPLCDWCHFQDVFPAFNDGVQPLLPEEQALRDVLVT